MILCLGAEQSLISFHGEFSILRKEGGFSSYIPQAGYSKATFSIQEVAMDMRGLWPPGWDEQSWEEIETGRGRSWVLYSQHQTSGSR
jgi:hypothetical protein